MKFSKNVEAKIRKGIINDIIDSYNISEEDISNVLEFNRVIDLSRELLSRRFTTLDEKTLQTLEKAKVITPDMLPHPSEEYLKNVKVIIDSLFDIIRDYHTVIKDFTKEEIIELFISATKVKNSFNTEPISDYNKHSQNLAIELMALLFILHYR